MECEYQQMSKQEFSKNICSVKISCDLHFFLMNTLLQIKFKRFSHCFCNLLNQEKCQICAIVPDFDSFEDELAVNMKNVDFF